MKSNLYNQNTVAGAVTREILRMNDRPTENIEGIAYKAAFDRMGSNADKHITAVERDDFFIRFAAYAQKCRKCKNLVLHRELLDGEICPHCYCVL